MTPTEFKEARRKLGLSAPQLSAMLGIDSTHVRRMEMQPGKPAHRPVRETIRRLLSAYLDGYRPTDWPS